MLKPKDYDDVQGYGEFKKLELGGHILVIKEVEEMESKTGKPMLKISLDTAPDDKQPNYFANLFREDIRPDKKWGCVVYQLVQDKDGNTNRGLKTFHTCVEKSNSGFKIQWGDKYASAFQGKRIGGVFGREQYRNKDGEEKFATKCFFFRSIDVIKAGVDLPEDKLLPVNPIPSNATSGTGWMNIPDGIEEELPFN